MTTETTARRVIEHVRSGIPSRVVAEHFPMGREALLARVGEDLASVESGVVPRVHLRFLRAPYGEGKSHALHAIWNLAASRQWLVSWAVLSRETPFDKLPTVYRKLIESTYLPDAAQPGFRRLLERLRPGSRIADEVLAFARNDLHGKVATVLENVLEGGATDALDDLYRDLAGDFLTIADVKAIHRRNFGKPVSIEPFRQQVNTIDYLRLVDFLSQTQGHRGWLILLDEMELVAKLGSKARARAYANLIRLRSGVLPHTYVICAIADNFYNQVLVREAERLPMWLEARQEADLAEGTRQALRAINDEALRLDPLAQGDLAAVFERLAADHAAAYGWNPPLPGPTLLQRVRGVQPMTDAPLRTLVRTAIYWLDTTWQYGHEPTLRIGRAEEEPLEQPSEADETGGPEGDGQSGEDSGPVWRNQVF